MAVSKQLYFLAALTGGIKTFNHGTGCSVSLRNPNSHFEKEKNLLLPGTVPTFPSCRDSGPPSKPISISWLHIRINSFCTLSVPAVVYIYCAFLGRSVKHSRALLLCEISALITQPKCVLKVRIFAFDFQNSNLNIKH
jgi:hypothetical protein